MKIFVFLDKADRYKMAFDILGIKTKATTKDILTAVRESRERSAE